MVVKGCYTRHMTNHKQKTQESPEERRAYLGRLAILWVLCVGIIALVYDMVPVVGGGNIAYYTKKIQCGRTPLVGKYNGSGMRWYEEARRTFKPAMGHELYFCTPLEAEQAGYSADASRFIRMHME